MTGKLRLRWSRDNAWHTEVIQADPVVEFQDEFLETLLNSDRNKEDFSLGDGILTIRGTNRTVSYGLSRYNLERMTTIGYLSGVDQSEAL